MDLSSTLLPFVAQPFPAAEPSRPGPPAPLTLALSGGSTPRRLYSLLASEEYRARLPWSRLHLFFADERCVPPDHPDSSYGMIRDLLLSRVGLPPDHLHRMRGEAEDPDEAARDYETELRAICPPAHDGTPILDLVLLGVGDDGHTASLFPGTEALQETARLVVAHLVPSRRAPRLTLTYPILLAARSLALLIAGAGKASIVRRLLAGDPSLPASRLLAHPNLTLLLDSAAASP